MLSGDAVFMKKSSMLREDLENFALFRAKDFHLRLVYLIFKLEQNSALF